MGVFTSLILTKVMATEIKRVKRLIHFYELGFEFRDDFEGGSDNDQCREFFALIKKIGSSRANIRYQQFGEKAIFLQDVVIKPADKVINGKLRCVRKDLLPEIMDTETDTLRDIETKEDEGLVETTHFVIDFSRKKKRLAFEYNQFGARITDFLFYLRKIGEAKKATHNIEVTPLVKDELKTIKDRINRVSRFVVKVHKDKIKEIEEMDGDLYGAITAAEEHYKSEYVELTYKFDYKERADTKEMNNTIKKLTNFLVRHKSSTETFNTLEVKAEDSQKNNRLEVFDLLIDKVKAEISVERKPKFRTIVSNDILPKMQEKLHALK